MPLPLDERMRKASAGRTRSATQRRYRRYTEEMIAGAGFLTPGIADLLAALLREQGYTVTEPVDAQEGSVTTPPSGR